MSLITPSFGTIFWMTLIFAIVLFILAKWGFPVITGMVEERNRRIEDSLRAAREAEKRLSSLAEDQARLLEETRRQQAELIKETSAAREAMVAQARQTAGDEASKIIAQARTQIAAEKESALRDIRAEVANLSVSVAEKILREHLSSDEAQTALVRRLVDEISTQELN